MLGFKLCLKKSLQCSSWQNMAATTQTDEFISITCENDKEFKMKRSLLARMRSIYITEHLGRLIGLKLTVIKLNSLTKIVQWLEHYPVGFFLIL